MIINQSCTIGMMPVSIGDTGVDAGKITSVCGGRISLILGNVPRTQYRLRVFCQICRWQHVDSRGVYIHAAQRMQFQSPAVNLKLRIAFVCIKRGFTWPLRPVQIEIECGFIVYRQYIPYAIRRNYLCRIRYVDIRRIRKQIERLTARYGRCHLAEANGDCCRTVCGHRQIQTVARRRCGSASRCAS